MKLSEEKPRECGLVIKFLQFLVILAASLVERVFRADQYGRDDVSRQVSKAPRAAEPAGSRHAR